MIREAKADVFEFEETLVLLQQRILGLGENANQRWFVEIIHDARDREAPDKFGNQAVANQIARLNLFEQLGVALLRSRRRGIGVEAERAAAGALFDDFFEADERATAEEQNVGGIDGRKFLMRV